MTAGVHGVPVGEGHIAAESRLVCEGNEPRGSGGLDAGQRLQLRQGPLDVSSDLPGRLVFDGQIDLGPERVQDVEPGTDGARRHQVAKKEECGRKDHH